jgi:hypothetical protein
MPKAPLPKALLLKPHLPKAGLRKAGLRKVVHMSEGRARRARRPKLRSRKDLQDKRRPQEMPMRKPSP